MAGILIGDWWEVYSFPFHSLKHVSIETDDRYKFCTTSAKALEHRQAFGVIDDYLIDPVLRKFCVDFSSAFFQFLLMATID